MSWRLALVATAASIAGCGGDCDTQCGNEGASAEDVPAAGTDAGALHDTALRNTPPGDATSDAEGRQNPIKSSFPHGEACASDAQCVGKDVHGEPLPGTCWTDLPGGYCALPCGEKQACIDGSACVPTYPSTGAMAGKTRWLCAKTCGDKTHCRGKAGYTCDRDRTCWPVPKQPALNNRPIGAPCWTDSQCGTKRCERPVRYNKATGYVGGACGKLDCDKSPCPGGSKCLKLTSGGSACFAACKSATDCRQGYRCVGGGCAPGCVEDGDCPDKHVCANKRCASAFFACSQTNPAGWCPDGGHCDGGACKPGKPSCDGDATDPFEPNDTQEQATALTRERTFSGKLCPGDGDWFSLTTAAGALTEVTLKFDHLAGDLDLLVHDGDGGFVRSRYKRYPYKGKLWADFDKSDESVAFFHPTNAQKVLLKVVGADPSVANRYGLVVRQVPYEDAGRCTDKRDADLCKGLPDGVLQLVHFPQPIVGDKGGAGAYRFGSVSGYKWARLELVMLIREALRRTRQVFPKSAPVEFADICQHDGVTPGYDIGKPRHCHTCHDQGGNIDIAYFQLDNDHSLRPICGKDGAQLNTVKKECFGGAVNHHLVDLDQQVIFMAALFDSPRTRAIGVDPVIGKLLQKRAQEMLDAGLITAAGNKGIQTRVGLWATHHDHIHVSLQWW